MAFPISQDVRFMNLKSHQGRHYNAVCYSSVGAGTQQRLDSLVLLVMPDSIMQRCLPLLVLSVYSDLSACQHLIQKLILPFKGSEKMQRRLSVNSTGVPPVYVRQICYGFILGNDIESVVQYNEM